MEVGEQGPKPILSHVEPVFAVRDIPETLTYWQDVLGFPAKWTWGDPPNHAGVSWQKVFIQFTLNPTLAASSKGNSIWIRVERIAPLYHFHQKNNAEIVAPLEDQPWGLAQYTLREVNGYYVHFAGPIAARERTEKKLPSTVRILGRPPAIKDYQRLGSAMGWSPMSEEDASLRLAAVVHAAIAEDTVSGEVIGCALLVGDHVSYYYVKDVMVHPNWQGQRVGSALMQELADWLKKNAANNALVGLFTGQQLESFYMPYGFGQAFGMVQYVHRPEASRSLEPE